eukprot:CAMPEP_0206361950 /NCGR_PEP_ID=MMETSP0294-20121207/667_1 /ASSEMBLY_ACC=CAM_ASM_000327 /TAXON_ID=39354 /ORGANISM="Heterosigma akashiwo, Strain CCMP2393" /LENGTH=133 /DNA_ID=CAMNT_0053806933 /DNA_START=72 /DNA_END=469 /DNA_ORIENTATION=+
MAQFSSNPGVGSSNSNTQTLWAPAHPEERSYYDGLFSIADTANAGSIAGKAAVSFFSLSGLDFSILKQVWDIADARGEHMLRREDFYVAMRLIAMAQAEKPLRKDTLVNGCRVELPMPRFRNVPPPPPPPPSP